MVSRGKGVAMRKVMACDFFPFNQIGNPAARPPVLFLLLLLLAAFLSALWINDASMITPIANTITTRGDTIISTAAPPPKHHRQPRTPFTCPTTTNLSRTHICRSSSPLPTAPLLPSSSSCPDYFRWIHGDLLPWKTTGITREMVDRAAKTANFHLVILDGRVYVERYRRAFQTRDVFSIWGILQLLARYPGHVPDLDLMFDCVDWPVVRASDYRLNLNNANASASASATAPPPLFRYCGDEATLDIVFPDWSFWGWPEINIKPWEKLTEELKEGNKKSKWMDREPYAYWKGNPAVAQTRQDLLKCNISKDHDWNARIYAQDWRGEVQSGFKESNLANQCIHRYKIYIEGSAWSVSEKYILACDSLALVVKPKYYDFFTRGLMPVHHYWPIRDDDKCRSIKFAVDWGNTHKQKAQAIAREGSNFIQENVKMEYVYDYMFHLLNEYAKLLRYKPTKPPKAKEWCSESMACPTRGREKEFMMDSLVSSPSDVSPCNLPPPFGPVELKMLQRRKANSIHQVEIWEQRARAVAERF